MTWMRRAGRGLALALAVMAASGCGPAAQQANAVVENATQTVEIVASAEGRSYRAVALAPDACYRVPEAAEAVLEGEVLTVTRRLVREPGLCATVITPVEVVGSLDDVPVGATTFRLVLLNAEGAVVFEATTPLET